MPRFFQTKKAIIDKHLQRGEEYLGEVIVEKKRIRLLESSSENELIDEVGGNLESKVTRGAINLIFLQAIRQNPGDYEQLRTSAEFEQKKAEVYAEFLKQRGIDSVLYGKDLLRNPKYLLFSRPIQQETCKSA